MRRTNGPQSATAERGPRSFSRRNLSLILLPLFAVIGGAAWLWSSRGSAAALSRLEQGAELARSGQLAGAVAQWEEAARIDPQNATTWELLGDAYIRDRRWRDGARAFRELIRVSPNAPEAHARLAGCLVHQGELDGAWTAAREELKRNPDSIPALVVVAKLGKAKEDEAERLSALRRLTRLKPDNRDYLQMLAVALSDQNALLEATEILDRIIRLDPDNAEAHARLGYALMRQGASPERLARAEGELKRSLAARPESAFTRYHLGEVLTLQGKNREAIPHLRAATRLQPRKSAVWYLLSSACRNSGDAEGADEALKQFQTARADEEKLNRLVMTGEQEPNNFDRQLELGRAHFERGDTRKARYYFVRALHLRPDDPQARDVLSRLQGLAEAAE